MEEAPVRSYKEIELLRGFAILAVMAIHVTGRSMNIGDFSSPMLIFRTIMAFSEFAVPLFFIISGFTLSMKFHDDHSLASFYTKRFNNIVPPYIVFSLLYMMFYVYYFKVSPNQLRLDDMLIKLLTARASLHLWYFRIIFQFYLFYPLMKNLLHKCKNHLLALLTASIMIQIVWICSCGPIEKFLVQSINPPFLVYLSYHSFLSYVSYFMVGMYTYYNYDKVLSLCSAQKFNYYIIAFIVCIAATKSYYRINDLLFEKFPLLSNLTIFYTCAVAMLLLKLSVHLKSMNTAWVRILFRCGQYSFGIYLIHVSIILMTERQLMKYLSVDIYQWYYYPICFFITAVLSLPLTYLISLMPYHAVLIGKVRRWELSA